MRKKKVPNEGTVPCLVCRRQFEYLNSGHLASPNCKPETPTDIESYREWVAKEFQIDRNDPIFETNQIQKPQYYREHAGRLDLPSRIPTVGHRLTQSLFSRRSPSIEKKMSVC
jgi:hypothetical protein